MSDDRIYLDAQAGQAPKPAVLELAKAMLGLSWNDGKSRNHEAAIAQNAQEIAIQTVANRLSLSPSQVIPVHRLGNVFDVLSGTFPDVAKSAAARKGAIQSFAGPVLPVDQSGRISKFDGFSSFFAPAANQETGVIEDINSIIEQSGAFAIVDATEWIGRVQNLPAGNILIARASAWGGPNSVCYIISKSENLRIDSRKLTSLRPSNFDLLWASAAFEQLDDISKTENQIRNFSIAICEKLSQYEEITIHGDKNALPHLISFDIKNVDSETAAIVFDKHAVAVGSGSACAITYSQSSHVLEAMGIKSAGNVRLSIPIDFTESHLEQFLEKIPAIVQELTQAL